MRPFLLSLLMLLPTLAAAQGGVPDPAFGANGRVTVRAGTSAIEGAEAVVRLPDGRIVVAGTAGRFGARQVAIVRLLPDGTPDASFGRDGRVALDVTVVDLGVSDVLALPDGRLVVAGTATGQNGAAPRGFVARLLPEGRLDPAFGAGGIAFTAAQAATAVALDAAGRLVVAGAVPADDNTSDLSLERLLADGAPDAAFGTGGALRFSFGPSTTEGIVSVAVDAAGRIVFAGTVHPVSTYFGVGVGRVTPEGALDASFGQGGLAFAVRPDASSFAAEMRLDAAGRIVVGATVADDFGALRFTATGALDASFGAGGWAVFDGPPGSNLVTALALDAAGRIVLVGLETDDRRDPAVVRLLPGGAPDASFGQGGRRSVDLGSRFDYLSGVAVRPDGSVIVAGDAEKVPSNGSDIVVAQLTPAGALDAAFGTGGIQRVGGVGRGPSEAQDVFARPDGRVLAVGAASRDGVTHLVAVQVTAAGALDPAFGTAGVLALPAEASVLPFASALLPDGSFVSAGPFFNADGTGGLRVARFTADGRLDATFGTGGTVSIAAGASPTYPASVAVQPDGRLVIAGSFPGMFSPEIGIVRLLPDGALDASFGTAGRVTVDAGVGGGEVAALMLDAEGRLLVAGQRYTDPGTAMLVARRRADGSPDPTFGAGGVVTLALGARSEAQAVAVQPDGAIVLTGAVRDNDVSAVAVVRLTPAGALDPSFGAGGIARVALETDTGADGVRIDASGRLVLTANTVLNTGASFETRVAVIRLTPAGALDATFGQDGRVLVDTGAALGAARALDLDPDGRIVVAGATGPAYNDHDLAIARLLPGVTVATEPSVSAVLTLAVSPNPTAGRATVRLETAQAEGVRVEVLDALGRRVLTLHDGPLAAGAHTFTLDAGALPAGTYLLRASGASVRAQRTVTVAR